MCQVGSKYRSHSSSTSEKGSWNYFKESSALQLERFLAGFFVIASYVELQATASFLFLFGKINHGAKKQVCQVLCVFSPLVHLDSVCAVHPLELDGMAQDDLEQMSCWRGPNWNQIDFFCFLVWIYLFIFVWGIWLSIVLSGKVRLFFSLIIFLWMFLATHGDFVFPFWA